MASTAIEAQELVAGATQDASSQLDAEKKQYIEATLQQQIAEAKNRYLVLLKENQDFKFPEAHISIESPEDPDSRRMDVHMEVTYNSTKFSFVPITPNHAGFMSRHLDLDPHVRRLYADGNTRTIEQTLKRAQDLSARFDLTASGEAAEPNLHLYSGFAVVDAEVEDQDAAFLGIAVVGGAEIRNRAEMARLNKVLAWRQSGKDASDAVAKQYQGVGTAEACVLMQYAEELKRRGYRINGEVLAGVESTSRVDNEASLISAIRAGSRLEKIAAKEIHDKNVLRNHLFRPVG